MHRTGRVKSKNINNRSIVLLICLISIVETCLKILLSNQHLPIKLEDTSV